VPHPILPFDAKHMSNIQKSLALTLANQYCLKIIYIYLNPLRFSFWFSEIQVVYIVLYTELYEEKPKKDRYINM